MSSVVLIPSRLNSRRLPGKALLDIGGLPMVVRVMMQASKCPQVDKVYVCTDSQEIAEVVDFYGGECIMTSSTHQNGTTRIAEAKSKIPPYDLYIDVQGDEPFIDPCHISDVIKCHVKFRPDIVLPLLPTSNPKSSHVKVVTNVAGRALYLSRANIPYQYQTPHIFFKHLSIISFYPAALDRFAELPPSPLEETEGIELLRAIENDMHVQTTVLSGESFSIDTPADYESALRREHDSRL